MNVTSVLLFVSLMVWDIGGRVGIPVDAAVREVRVVVPGVGFAVPGVASPAVRETVCPGRTAGIVEIRPATRDGLRRIYIVLVFIIV